MTPTSNSAAATTNRLVGQVAQDADETIRSTQRVANEALDRLSEAVHETHDKAAPKLVHLAERAEALARRSADAVRDGTQQVREKAVMASDRTIAYIKDEPVKAVLIAAAAGAAMVVLANMISRSRH